VQVPAGAKASQGYPKPMRTPGGKRWHIELVSGTLNRSAIDLI
jgi:hypothetical protein